MNIWATRNMWERNIDGQQETTILLAVFCWGSWVLALALPKNMLILHSLFGERYHMLHAQQLKIETENTIGMSIFIRSKRT